MPAIECRRGTSDAGAIVLSATIGQPDTGPGTAGMSGGALTLVGSVWPDIPACRADFNGAGGITVQDIFDFLAAWFAGCP